MDKAVAAHDRGDTKRKAFHLDNAKQARYSLKSTEIAKHKDLLDKYKSMNEETQLEAIDKEHPIVKEYDALKKHDIKHLRGIIKQQHKIIDTSGFTTKDHAASHILRTRHGDKKVAQAFGLKEDADLEEAAWGKDKITNLRQAHDRHMQKALDANKAGDDEAVKTHQRKMQLINTKIQKLKQNEDAPVNNVGGGNIAGTQGDAGKKAVMTKKPMKRNIIQFKEYAIDAKGHKSSTGGLTQKGVDAYNRKTGGNLQTAVTTPPSKLDPDSKAAKRRKSFCARMSGMPGPMKDEKSRPTRKALALRKWNC
jgi:hypothetical protein